MNDGFPSSESHSVRRDAPLTRPRPKVAPSELPPGAARPLGDYRKTPLFNGDATVARPPEIPQPSADAILRLPDEELEQTVHEKSHDTLANLQTQMLNLAQSLVVDAPVTVSPEWIAEPARYRLYVLSELPSAENPKRTTEVDQWLGRFLRLVTLDIRARRLGNLQRETSPFWTEVLRHDAIKKKIDVEGRHAHTKAINARAQTLFEEWKSLSAEERTARQRENDNVRAHQKFVLLRAQETCRAKDYGSAEEAERDGQMLDTLGDNILMKDRFAQLIDTSSERATPVTAEFDDDEPTVVKAKTVPPSPPKPPVPTKPSFFRRMTAPFVAAASLLVGLGAAEQTAERSTNLLSQPDTKEQAYGNGEKEMERWRDGEMAKDDERSREMAESIEKATPEAPAEAVAKTHIVEKGERLWDIARQELADERGVALKRVARKDSEILPRVEALKILNHITDATKLEVGTVLQLEEVEAPVAKEAPQAAPSSRLEAGAIDDATPDASHNIDTLLLRNAETPPEVIARRGDTAWAHADRMLRDAKVKPTLARRQLVAALMLRESGNLNAYRLKVGQELATGRAYAAIDALKNGKNPSDIARAAGIPWPPKNL